MGDNDTMDVESILYRVCDFERSKSNTFVTEDEKIQKNIDMILNFMRRDSRFESYDYEKHKNLKRIVYVFSFGLLISILGLNRKIQKIPFVNILLSFNARKDTRYKNVLNLFPQKEGSKMISIGISREQNKPHFIFKKENSFQFKYAIEISNTFVLKKDLEKN